MPFTVKTDAPPLREDAAGALRVGDSRVLLELVIRTFQDGSTAEYLVQREQKAEEDSTLALADVYAVITYYQQGDLSDIRARLLERRKA
jgi:hypothetical protein